MIVRAMELLKASLGLCVAEQRTPFNCRQTFRPSFANCSNAGSARSRENSSAQHTKRRPSRSVRTT